jgi:hypothetical protein
MPASTPRFKHLEQRLDSVRQQLKIPAMSCAIVKDQKVVWAKGFGYADVENKIPATEHTSYHLASLTKTFASTILMQRAGGKGQTRRSVPSTGSSLKAMATGQDLFSPPKTIPAKTIATGTLRGTG